MKNVVSFLKFTTKNNETGHCTNSLTLAELSCVFGIKYRIHRAIKVLCLFSQAELYWRSFLMVERAITSLL